MSKRRVSLVFALVALVLTVFFLVGATNSLNAGLGFGRDVRMIIDVKDAPEQLNEFIKVHQANGHEIYIDSMSDTIKMVSFSGITDFQTFLSQVSSNLWQTSVLEIGTFGSLANLGQFMFTFEFYMSAFVLGFIVYWTIRFKSLGLFSSLMIFTSILGTLLILDYLNYPFTHIVWFSMILSFCILIFQQKYLIAYISNDSFKTSQAQDVLMMRQFLYHTGAVFALSVILNFSGVVLPSASRYFAVISAFMLCGALLSPVLFRLIRELIVKDDEQWLLSFSRISEFSTDKALKIWGGIVVFGLIAALMGGILFSQMNVRSSELNGEYKPMTLFLIEAEDAQSFIEMQASFATTDVLNDQITFLISEDSSMWFFYNEYVNFDNLLSARDSIERKIGVSGTIYEFNSLDSPLNSWNFYVALVLSLIVGYFIANTHTNHKYGLLSIVLSLLTLAFCALWFQLFNIGLSRMTLLLVLLIPILNAFFLIATPLELRTYSWLNRIVYVTNRLGLIMMIIGVPILLIIPNPNDSILVMIGSLIIWSVSAVCSFLFYPLFVKGQRHETIS